MKISVNQIHRYQKQYQWSDDPAPEGIDALLQRIGVQLAGIDEVVAYGDRFRGVLVARVVSVENHPDADRLHVCKIDDGGKTEGVERDENGYVQVVCGAPNVRTGITVAWLPPGSTVPNTRDKDPFVLEARPLRGVISNGMLASPKELTIGDAHEGILELDTEAAPGTSFAQAYDLEDDAVIDMENKMFTHRPDCFGMLGVAREIAGIQQQAFTSPEWWRTEVDIEQAASEELPLSITNEIPGLVSRFTALTMKDIAVRPSPVWLQVELARLGVRPINNVVDLTNYNMLLTGQPLHAYDYDKVAAQDDATTAGIVIRHPQPGEKITLLGGKEIEPRSEAIVIASRNTLIGVGGVMGGADTEVDESTKNIIIEVANFNMYSIRRTSMAHGLFTDAVTRFNKGQSPLQTKAVLAKVVDDLKRLTGATVAGRLIDDNHLPADILAIGSMHPAVHVSRQFINTRLGLDLSTEDITRLLANVEFQIDTQGEDMTVTAPFWRTDIAIPEDIVEEVGRLYGYDHLPPDLPKRSLTPPQKDSMLSLKALVRNILASAGANEVLAYSFVHGNLLDTVGQNRDQAFQLSNALSPDLQYFRLSLTPSLLEKVHPNIKAGYSEFALFEIGKAHIVGVTEPDEPDVPAELERLSLVFAANTKGAEHYTGAAYYQARKYLDYVLSALHMTEKVTIEPLNPETYEGATQAKIAPYDAKRAAVIRIGDVVVGEIGEYKASVQKALKLPGFCAGFELDLSVLFQHQSNTPYIQLPRFPKVEQDICLKVDTDMPYQNVLNFVTKIVAEAKPEHTLPTMTPIDIYQREGDTAHKQITLRLSLASYQRTLTDEEVSKLLDHVANVAATELSAQRV